ncbi:jg14741 [Pararge aegeria aegeria]|uniref:Jg14741 protein n=1 Tax=Pararge aegeria aegeria TaxID=348720 RepID=A0A8S4SJ97_9NEOP|nr:jg14741 [Pararge aegeria aegeria]
MATPENVKDIIQYVPFTSFVNPSFWHSFTDIKFNVDKLSENTKQIYGRFSYANDIGPVFEVDGTAFNKQPEAELMYLSIRGTLMNKNTIDDFKSIDKASLLNSIGEIIWHNSIITRLWMCNPSCLLNFFILSFADLKKYHYYYWFAFPTPSQPTVFLKEKSKSILTEFNESEIRTISQNYQLLHHSQRCFFVIRKENETVKVETLSNIFNRTDNTCNLDISSVYFAFTDPSNNGNPGWPLRIFLAALLEYSAIFHGSVIKVIGIRSSKEVGCQSSQIFNVMLPENVQCLQKLGWVGWERNDRGNFGPKLSDMSASMSPKKLAAESADLNIKLMQWRLVPDLNIEIMKNTKCLLIGAGTLGCQVARNLLAWGFRHIHFVDKGKVSYSNPTRQVLYTYHDCRDGGKNKVDAAAESLLSIHPDVIVINSALGFDSYLVMRHGIWSPNPESTTIHSTYVPGDQVGCYFCNDVTAPGNSQKDRTLDQQCTVTRPGVAAIAGALAVELLASLLQHKLGVRAPAPYNISDEMIDPEFEGVLGPVPHSIRGFLHSYQTVVPTYRKFKQCIACSEVVIDNYRKEGINFLLNVFNSGTYLEEVTGLTELQLTAEMSEVLTFSDEDQDTDE